MNDYELALKNIMETIDMLHRHISDGTFSHPYWSISKIKELIDKHNKYKWHDLRKNQGDLPNDNRKKLVIVRHNYERYECEVWSSYDLAYYSELLHKWTSVTYNSPAYKIIAWREIAPFEVTE